MSPTRKSSSLTHVDPLMGTDTEAFLTFFAS